MKLRWEDTVEDRARAVVECYLEDMKEEHPDLERQLTTTQRNVLLHHIGVAICAQRTEYHVEKE